MNVDLNFVKAVLSVIGKTTIARNRPFHLQVEPTSACNLLCNFCSRDNTVLQGKQMNFETFRELFDQIKPARVTWAGRGEPLLCKDLPEMVSYAHNNGAKTVITTNFTLGKQKALQLIEAGIDDLRISIDTPNPETYKVIRGKDLHQQVLEGIEEVNKIKKSKNLSKPSVGFEIVSTGRNIAEGPDILKLAGKYQVNRVDFRPLGLIGVEEKREDLLYGLNYKDFLKILLEIKKTSENIKMPTNIDHLIKSFPFIWQRYTGEAKRTTNCIYLWLQVYVNVDGEITPCCALNMDDKISMGNVIKEGFLTVWNGEKYKSFRKDSTATGKLLPYESCNQCLTGKLWQTVRRAKFLK